VIIRELEWDDDNIEHIHHHKVSPVEVEDVCFGLRYRYVLYGQTRAGRYLKVVLQRLQGNRFRPITAFDMSDEDKAHCRRRLK